MVSDNNSYDELLQPFRRKREDLQQRREALKQEDKRLEDEIARIDRIFEVASLDEPAPQATVQPTLPLNSRARPRYKRVSSETLEEVRRAMSYRREATARELAVIAKVSSSTVRGALAQLENEGAVYQAGEQDDGSIYGKRPIIWRSR
jgi:DNA-binding transcriptional ArsR family regulator